MLELTFENQPSCFRYVCASVDPCDGAPSQSPRSRGVTMEQSVLVAIARFPDRGHAIAELARTDEDFRSYAPILWTPRPRLLHRGWSSLPGSAARSAEYKDLERDLAGELEAALNRHFYEARMQADILGYAAPLCSVRRSAAIAQQLPSLKIGATSRSAAAIAESGDPVRGYKGDKADAERPLSAVSSSATDFH
jgi:hypothetical protein